MKTHYTVRCRRWIEVETLVEFTAAGVEDFELGLQQELKNAEWDETGMQQESSTFIERKR